MREEPRPLQVYKHFKGNYYQILAVAKHSETEEKLVIYRPLFEGDQVCARPLEMFLSDVDHDKYPEVKQKYRFALVTGHGRNVQHAASDEAATEVKAQDKPEEENTLKDTDETTQDSLLDKFLDAQSAEEKLDILTGSWKTITEDNIDNIAVVLDMELNGKTLEEKYKEILNFLKLRAKYESVRLR